MRRILGRFIEWLLSYEHVVVVRMQPGAKLPSRKYPGDAGYDLYCNRDVCIPAGSTIDVPSGVYMDPRESIWMELKARSSTLKVLGLEVVDAVIDKDYRGELMAVIHNPSGTAASLKAGDRVVQIVPHRLIPTVFRIGKLSESARGTKGFGSTGRSRM